jgi:hypothetical protein
VWGRRVKSWRWRIYPLGRRIYRRTRLLLLFVREFGGQRPNLWQGLNFCLSRGFRLGLGVCVCSCWRRRGEHSRRKRRRIESWGPFKGFRFLFNIDILLLGLWLVELGRDIGTFDFLFFNINLFFDDDRFLDFFNFDLLLRDWQRWKSTTNRRWCTLFGRRRAITMR